MKKVNDDINNLIEERNLLFEVLARINDLRDKNLVKTAVNALFECLNGLETETYWLLIDLYHSVAKNISSFETLSNDFEKYIKNKQISEDSCRNLIIALFHIKNTFFTFFALFHLKQHHFCITFHKNNVRKIETALLVISFHSKALIFD